MTTAFEDFRNLFTNTSYFALSFDGYKYREENNEFNDIENKEKLLEGKEIEEKELLPTLFFLQRFISRGDQAVNEKHYKIFFELFLKCLDLQIPTKFKNSEYFEKWEKLTKSEIEEIKKKAKEEV